MTSQERPATVQRDSAPRYDAKVPAVTVILPIFNAEPYLDQALDSVQQQTLGNIEIICLNDGSTDNSLAIMQNHASTDSRIRVIDKKNQGYGATCNRGFDEARGSYIAIVEPDDWIESGMFKDMLGYADRFDEQIDIIKTPYWRIWMPDTPQQHKMNCSYYGRIKPTEQPFAISDPGAVHLLCHHPSIWSALYRKEFLDRNHIRMREYPGAGWADNPFLIETLCRAKNIIYLETPYYCYREDTPEKLTAFAKRSTLLPLERWNDMQDVLDGLGVTNENIQRAHNSRGFTYLSGIIEEVDLSHADVRQAALKMFNRMNAHLVIGDPEISPRMQRLFAEYRGLPEPKTARFSYYMRLIREGFYKLRTTGLGYTFYETRKYFSKNRQR